MSNFCLEHLLCRHILWEVVFIFIFGDVSGILLKASGGSKSYRRRVFST